MRSERWEFMTTTDESTGIIEQPKKLDTLLKSTTYQGMTDEEIQAAAEKAEAEQKRREEDNALMERYYGDYLNTPSNAEVVVLTLDELDDDRMIAYMEDTPAYKRTAQDLVPLRGKERPLSYVSASQVSDKTKSDKTKRGGRVISF